MQGIVKGRKERENGMPLFCQALTVVNCLRVMAFGKNCLPTMASSVAPILQIDFRCCIVSAMGLRLSKGPEPIDFAHSVYFSIAYCDWEQFSNFLRLPFFHQLQKLLEMLGTAGARFQILAASQGFNMGTTSAKINAEEECHPKAAFAIGATPGDLR